MQRHVYRRERAIGNNDAANDFCQPADAFDRHVVSSIGNNGKSEGSGFGSGRRQDLLRHDVCPACGRVERKLDILVGVRVYTFQRNRSRAGCFSELHDAVVVRVNDIKISIAIKSNAFRTVELCIAISEVAYVLDKCLRIVKLYNTSVAIGGIDVAIAI